MRLDKKSFREVSLPVFSHGSEVSMKHQHWRPLISNIPFYFSICGNDKVSILTSDLRSLNSATTSCRVWRAHGRSRRDGGRAVVKGQGNFQYKFHYCAIFSLRRHKKNGSLQVLRWSSSDVFFLVPSPFICFGLWLKGVRGGKPR